MLPGASSASAVRYIDTLLSAFEVDPPKIFAGGPYSDRNALPNADGTASQKFPPNDFETFLPLSRVQDIAWRMRVLGSAATPGGDFNDAVLGPTVGYRDIYAQALAALDAMGFRSLGHDDQVVALATVSADQPAFASALLAHTI
ncbi:MAG TPA: hypothetical protein VGC41_05365 [Kofleriaceae bacterium]